jgi:hypothetical protein
VFWCVLAWLQAHRYDGSELAMDDVMCDAGEPKPAVASGQAVATDAESAPATKVASATATGVHLKQSVKTAAPRKAANAPQPRAAGARAQAAAKQLELTAVVRASKLVAGPAPQVKPPAKASTRVVASSGAKLKPPAKASTRVVASSKPASRWIRFGT